MGRDRQRAPATEWAANVGKLVAYGCSACGSCSSLNGNVIGGLWIAAIGWFLHNAASTSVQQLVFETRLRKVRAGDVVRPDDEPSRPA